MLNQDFTTTTNRGRISEAILVYMYYKAVGFIDYVQNLYTSMISTEKGGVINCLGDRLGLHSGQSDISLTSVKLLPKILFTALNCLTLLEKLLN